MATAHKKTFPRFGNQIPFCEPYWYQVRPILYVPFLFRPLLSSSHQQGYPSPYYHEGHVAFRNKVRKFVEEEIKPHVDEWIKSPTGYPKELHQRAYEAGIQVCFRHNVTESISDASETQRNLQGIIYDKEFGGTKPDDFDTFYEIILCDEMSRMGGGGVLGQAAINSMALPPIMLAGSEEMKRKVCPAVISGKKNICLAISEPYAGSDVANLKTTARKEGKYYIVNGLKKWITGGMVRGITALE